mmetsp:Transcript_26382/g.78007  ORF Transcript_26382/g.78007 Transcript_26382/m.78007 type:complete len:112 (+) Transcript_26382:728-1063(+)
MGAKVMPGAMSLFRKSRPKPLRAVSRGKSCSAPAPGKEKAMCFRTSVLAVSFPQKYSKTLYLSKYASKRKSSSRKRPCSPDLAALSSWVVMRLAIRRSLPPFKTQTIVESI